MTPSRPLFRLALLLTSSAAAVFAFSACSSTAAQAPADAATQAQRMQQRSAMLEIVVAAPSAELYRTEWLDWTDASRNRPVLAKLYAPTQTVPGKPVPLVVFSHGIGGSREGYSYLGKYWAANGIAALHVQHVGSDRSIWGGNPVQMVGRLQNAAQEAEAIDRAKDVSFALDQVLKNPTLAAQLDAKRIAAAGHSYGANTTMLLAGATVQRETGPMNLRDPRIQAAVLLSAPPFYRESDPARIVATISLPSLHITAKDDDITIPGYSSGLKDREAIYRDIGSAKKALVVFAGGSHSVFTDRLGTGGVDANPKIKAATRDLTLAFWQQVFGLVAPAAPEPLQAAQHRAAPLLMRFEHKG